MPLELDPIYGKLAAICSYLNELISTRESAALQPKVAGLMKRAKEYWDLTLELLTFGTLSL